MNNNDKGFTITEAVIAIAMVSLIMIGVGRMVQKMADIKGMSSSLQQIDKIALALETTYKENILVISNFCVDGGWEDTTDLSGNCTKLLPVPIDRKLDSNGKYTTLIATLPTQRARNAWTNAGCSYSTTSSTYTYEIKCKDGYGEEVEFTALNLNSANPGSPYLNGYTNKPVSITYKLGGGRNITNTWTTGNLDRELLEKSSQKRRELLSAMSSYHLARLTHEVVSNTGGPTGGLISGDDVIIPWIWQANAANATNAKQQCETEETTGSHWGCKLFDNTSIWKTDASLTDLDKTANAADRNRFLTNIGLQASKYKLDEFGNAITIRILADNNGNKLSDPPPRPIPAYTNCLAGGDPTNCGGTPLSVMPPFRGAVGVINPTTNSWAARDDIIYPQ